MICLCICLGMVCYYKKKQHRRRVVLNGGSRQRDTQPTATAINLRDVDEKLGAEPVASSSTFETSLTNSGLYPNVSDDKEEDKLKSSSNGAPPSYNDFSTFPSVAGLQVNATISHKEAVL